VEQDQLKKSQLFWDFILQRYSTTREDFTSFTPSFFRNFMMTQWAEDLYIKGGLSKTPNIKRSTIDNYLGSVREEVLYHGILDPRLNDHGVVFHPLARFLRKIASSEKMPVKRRAIGIDILQTIHRLKDDVTWGPIFQWMVAASFFGLRACEWMKLPKSQTTVNKDGQPRRFLRSDVKFYKIDSNDLLIEVEDYKIATKVKLTFREQKNHDNGQEVTIDKTGHSWYCPVLAMGQLVGLHRKANHPPDSPLAIHSVRGSYTAINRLSVTKLIQRAVTIRIPDISAEDLKLYTPHSFRVVALIRLVSAKYPTHAIMVRLRWKSSAHIEYMRSCKISEESLLLKHEFEVDDEDIEWDDEPTDEFIHPEASW
jgi:hypothetical protein